MLSGYVIEIQGIIASSRCGGLACPVKVLVNFKYSNIFNRFLKRTIRAKTRKDLLICAQRTHEVRTFTMCALNKRALIWDGPCAKAMEPGLVAKLPVLLQGAIA